MSKFSLTDPQFKAMVKAMAANPRQLFLSPNCRQVLALQRFREAGAPVRVFEQVSDGVMPGTVAHNRGQIDDGSFASAERTLRLINPLSAIERIYYRAAAMTVLSIGPRTEMELLHLVGAGFTPQNIKAIDLISTSAWIDPGDMHALPYADQSFDITISSWVLGYSSTPQKAVDEMLRVTRSGGYIAIGCSFNPEADVLEYKDPQDKILGSRFRRVSEYLALIGAKLDRIYFQDEPIDHTVRAGVILVASIKH